MNVDNTYVDTENQDSNTNSTSLVEHESQLNLSSNSQFNNSKTSSITNLNDCKSKLNNSIDNLIDNSADNDNQNDKLIKSTNDSDNQVNGLADDECGKVNNEFNNQINQVNGFTVDIDESSERQSNSLHTESIDPNDSIIEKLELNLDYRKSNDLNLLEQSTCSILSSNKSESNSLDAVLDGSTNSKSNSRANSPCRSSQNSLQFPPKRINNESSTNLLINELDPKSHDEQLRFFKIEKMNLLHLSSLILNNLINNISPLTKTLECHDNIVLYDFFSITEQILKHGLKGKINLKMLDEFRISKPLLSR